MNRPESTLQIHRRRLNNIKNFIIVFTTLALLIGLLTSFVTSQTPWQLNRYIPSVVEESHLKQKWVNEVLLPSGLGSIDDDGQITGWIHTKTSGTVLKVQADQTFQSSTSIILKEYSLFVYADSSKQVWLHRGQKSLSAYGETSNVLWEQRFATWAENAWASDDGYILVSTKENDTDWAITLFDASGNLLWKYNTTKQIIVDAKIAPQGKGVLLTTRTQQAPAMTEFSLINPYGLLLDHLSMPVATTHSTAIHPNGVLATVSADQYLYSLEDPAKKTLSTSSMLPSATSTESEESQSSIQLPAPITKLVYSDKNNSVVAACWDEINKTGFLSYLDRGTQLLWSEPLRQKLLVLGVHPSGYAIYGGSNGEVFTYTNQGTLIWKHGVTENNLIDLAFSASGEFVAGLDQTGKLILWQIP